MRKPLIFREADLYVLQGIEEKIDQYSTDMLDALLAWAQENPDCVMTFERTGPVTNIQLQYTKYLK